MIIEMGMYQPKANKGRRNTVSLMQVYNCFLEK